MPIDMGTLGSVFGKGRDLPARDPMRELLFGDTSVDRWGADATSDAFPWSAFASARGHVKAGEIDAAVRDWREVLDRPDLESRHYLQAWHFLRRHGQTPPADVAKRVLGVVVEAGMPEGLDVVAAYADHSARYLNFSGKRIVWDAADPLDGAIDELLAAAQPIVDRIGPWTDLRPGPPAKGQVRLSFLTPSGLHFGEGPFDAISRDALAGAVLQRAMMLMKALVDKTSRSAP
jgi:nitroreductase